MEIPVGYICCDSLIYDYPFPLLQFENDSLWYNMIYKGKRIPYMSVYPRLNTTGYIAGSSIDNINQGEISIDIYPNPTKENITLTASEDILIFNSLGQIVKQIPNPKGKITISISELPQGIYYLQSGNKRQKLIKE